MNTIQFKDLPISAELLQAVSAMGFEEPTPIQAEAIPPLLERRDVLGQAQTGTGKTCAFGIPVIEETDASSKHIRHLILSPTRELAMQIADELSLLAKHKPGIRILAIYGGQPMERQLTALRKHPQIIVGTPGRVMDHMRRGTLKLDKLESLVLDEADEMLNMGFREDIDTILADTPSDIQRVLFSATMPRAILEIAEKYLTDPLHIDIKSETKSVSSIAQSYIELRESSKTEALCRLIEAEQINLALIFCNTKNRVDELTSKLQTRGYAAEGLHGDMNQRQRTSVMNAFKQGRTEFLIATDVAARGIDVDDIEMVINYDLPGDAEYYVHRIGRTGRAGKSGKAISFVVGREIIDLRRIAKIIKASILPMTIPSVDVIQETRISGVLANVQNRLSKNPNIDQSYTEALVDALEELNLMSGADKTFTMTDIAAAFLLEELSDRASVGEEIEPVVPYDEYLKTRNRKGKSQGKQSPYQNTQNRKQNRHEGKRKSNPRSKDEDRRQSGSRHSEDRRQSSSRYSEDKRQSSSRHSEDRRQSNSRPSEDRRQSSSWSGDERRKGKSAGRKKAVYAGEKVPKRR